MTSPGSSTSVRTLGLPPMPFLSLGRAHFTSLNGMMPVSCSSESLPVEVRVGRKPICGVFVVLDHHGEPPGIDIAPHVHGAERLAPIAVELNLLHHAPEAMPVIIGD